jgi:AbrB family looped-hinge helix DNA binding protein
METTVSSKFQVVIPRPVREAAGLRPQQKLQVFEKGGIVYLVPVPSLEDLRGIARGIDLRGYREKTERLP